MMMRKSDKNTTVRFILLAGIFGIIVTIATYDGFGYSSHIEHLPIIFRAMDSTYLQNDFLTNAGSAGIARNFYAQFIGNLAGTNKDLPLVFLILTFVSNISLSVMTFLFGKHFFRESNITAIFASALVMSISTTALGGTTPYLYSTYLLHATLAQLIILAAILVIAKKKLLFGMVLCGFTSILHPLWGLEMGALLLFSYVVTLLIAQKKIDKSQWKRIILGAFIFILLSLPSIKPQFSQESIDTDLYIHILAYFRNPHHYLPSTFPLGDYVTAAAFLAAAVIAWGRRYHDLERFSNILLGVLVGSILLLCFGGYIFVEIFPLKLWVMAQPFRLFSIIRWFGLILVAGLITGEREKDPSKFLYVANVFSPITLGISALTQSIRDWFIKNGLILSKVFEPILILLIIFIIKEIFRIKFPITSIILFSIYFFLILIFRYFPKNLLYLSLISLLSLVIIFGLFHAQWPYSQDSYTYNMIDRVYNLIVSENLSLKMRSDLGEAGDDIVNFVEQNTPYDSLFLSPPSWGQFRILADRAIVVDFNAFVFTDLEMLEWYRRITDCYGFPDMMEKNEIILALRDNYAAIDDEKLRFLRDKYNIDYAVLYAETNTKLEVLYENSNYKVVKFQ